APLCRVRELLAEAGEIAEGGADRLADRATRLATAVSRHDLPEQGVVGVSTAVVPNRRLNVAGNLVELPQQLVYILRRLEFRVLLECSVQIVDVRLMVLRMVDLHRPCVDMRLQRIVRVRKIRERVSGHEFASVSMVR